MIITMSGGEGSVVEAEVGRRPTHRGGWTRFSIRKKQLHYFADRALYALSLSLSLSLSRSPGGIILGSLFPHDARKTKDSTQSHRLSLPLCGTDRPLLCLRISCERVRSGRFSFLSFHPPSASVGCSARRAIDYIFPAEIETSFRLSIIDSSVSIPA